MYVSLHARSSECAIERTLRDPMTIAIMRADGVDREELRGLLRDAAIHVSPRRGDSGRLKRIARATFGSW